MAGLRFTSTTVPPLIPQNLFWNVVSQLVLDIALPKISNVISTVRLSGLNLIHAEKALSLARRLGAAPVLEIASEAALEIPAVVPVLEIVNPAPVLEAPIIDPKTTCPVIQVFSVSFAPALELAAEADVVVDAAPNVAGPIIDSVFRGIVSPIFSPTVPYDTAVTAGPLTELLDFTFDSASPRLLGPTHLLSDNPPLLDMTAAYSIFLLLVVILNWAVTACRRVAKSVSAKGPVIDKRLLLVADFHTYMDGLAKEYGLPIEGAKDLCNSYSTCLLPQALVSGNPGLTYEGFTLQPQLCIWAEFGTRLDEYRKERQLSPQVWADLLECYVTGNFQKFCPWDNSESAAARSADDLVVQASGTLELSADNRTSTLHPRDSCPPPSTKEVSGPSLSSEVDVNNPTTSPPRAAAEKPFKDSATPSRPRSASVPDAGFRWFSPEFIRSPQTPDSLKGVPLDHLMLGRSSGRKALRDLEKRMSARIAGFIVTEFNSWPGTGRKTDTATPSDLDLASLNTPPCKEKKNLGRRGTPAPFGFKKDVVLSESDMSPVEDDLKVEGLSFVSQSDSDSLPEGAYEARFSRPSIGKMGSEFSASGSSTGSSEAGAESTEGDEEVGSSSGDSEIAGPDYSDEEEVIADEIHSRGFVPSVKLPHTPGNTVLKSSLSPAEKITPAVEVAGDEEDDEVEEPQAYSALENSSDNAALEPSLSPAEYHSTVEVVDEEDRSQANIPLDNTVLKPSLSPVENHSTVEVVDEEDESTTPPMSPRACLNTLRTIPEDSDDGGNLSDTTVSPISKDRNTREDKDTLVRRVQSRLIAPLKEYPFDESMEGSQEMENLLGTQVSHSNQDGWRVVAPKGKGKAPHDQGLGASIWAKQTPSGSSLGFSHLECAEGESDSDDVIGQKSEVNDLNESPAVDTSQDQDADEDCETTVADGENQGPMNKKKSRCRGSSWWFHKEPRENHRNRGKRGWERKEARRLRDEAAQSRKPGASSSATQTS
ncbi:hypothetical protein MD484_g5065, partial [Candolleomyces efflorescens]